MFAVTLYALVAFHIQRVHTSHAVVGTTATGMIMRVSLHMADEIRILDEHMSYLEQFEAFIHNLLTVVARLHTTDVDESWRLRE